MVDSSIRMFIVNSDSEISSYTLILFSMATIMYLLDDKVNRSGSLRKPTSQTPVSMRQLPENLQLSVATGLLQSLVEVDCII